MHTEHIVEVEKFNPYHDSKGRFSTANSAATFTYKPGKSKAHDLAIAREKERTRQMRSALIKEDPVHISATYRQGRNTSSHRSYMTRTVLEAKETNPGELSLDYATPTDTTRYRNGNVDYEFDLSTGVYASSNSSGVNSSVGIDWDKVTTVSGNTYDAQYLLKQKGFYYDSTNKIYTKNKPQPPKATAQNGKLVIPKGGDLPSDLSGITSISGDTYANKDQIKAAGFKWNSATREWVKKSARFDDIEEIESR